MSGAWRIQVILVNASVPPAAEGQPNQITRWEINWQNNIVLYWL
jgi:hypothetical protein